MCQPEARPAARYEPLPTVVAGVIIIGLIVSLVVPRRR